MQCIGVDKCACDPAFAISTLPQNLNQRHCSSCPPQHQNLQHHHHRRHEIMIMIILISSAPSGEDLHPVHRGAWCRQRDIQGVRHLFKYSKNQVRIIIVPISIMISWYPDIMIGGVSFLVHCCHCPDIIILYTQHLKESRTVKFCVYKRETSSFKGTFGKLYETWKLTL